MTIDQRTALADSRRPSWGKVNRARYQAARKVAGKSILDVGCSKGDYVQQFRKAGYLAFGIDLLPDSGWVESSYPVFACANATALPFPDHSFDTIMAFEVLEHIPNPASALNEFRRVCIKNLVLSVPNCEAQPDILSAGLTYSHWNDRTHCNFFTRPLLQTTLEACGFHVIELSMINRAFLDYPVFRSYHLPEQFAYLLARILARLPFRKQYFITILAVAERVST